MAIDIVFEATSNKIIDRRVPRKPRPVGGELHCGSLRLGYLKLIPIDLTDRVKPYLNNNRLVVKDVRIPQGWHCLQVLIGYKSGEKTLMEILLNVVK